MGNEIKTIWFCMSVQENSLINILGNVLNEVAIWDGNGNL